MQNIKSEILRIFPIFLKQFSSIFLALFVIFFENFCEFFNLWSFFQIRANKIFLGFVRISMNWNEISPTITYRFGATKQESTLGLESKSPNHPRETRDLSEIIVWIYTVKSLWCLLPVFAIAYLLKRKNKFFGCKNFEYLISEAMV